MISTRVENGEVIACFKVCVCVCVCACGWLEAVQVGLDIGVLARAAHVREVGDVRGEMRGRVCQLFYFRSCSEVVVSHLIAFVSHL